MITSKFTAPRRSTPTQLALTLGVVWFGLVPGLNFSPSLFGLGDKIRLKLLKMTKAPLLIAQNRWAEGNNEGQPLSKWTFSPF